ncbi:MAG TPA: PrsW family glutamic-type intramembrane protease [Gemmatimonadaceae bacterium]|nr:PrsW family glutamic-type intramembrane protease [Gemmatimonadaceae bacterium]
MILAIIFAQVWGVIQLIVLTSLARTVRVRTVLAAMAVGFYAIGPVTAFLQLSWIRIAAHVFGKAVFDLTGVASYTVDPFIEEAMKLLPLLVLFLIPAIRRQWSVTDCLLIAAATGSGFGLTEHLFRYADYASTAQSVSGGYMMTIGSATPLVPGIVRTLTSWIPLGVFFESSAVHVNWHLAWSAITGLAVGLFLRNPKKWARPTAVGLLLLVCLNHAAGNAASVQYTWLSPLAAPMRLLDSLLAFLVLVAIVAAWWLDQPSQRAGMALGPLLAAEQSAPTRLSGTLTAAVRRLPWSISWVCGFDRARRAYHAARNAAPGSVDDMRDAMIAQRDSVDRKLSQTAPPPLLPSAWMPSNLGTTLRTALRRPPVIIWLVLIAPSVFYLIIGGFPATSGLQAVMKGPIVWPIVLLITLCNQGRKAWSVLTGVRKLPAAARHPIGDDAAMLTLQAVSGLGTLSLAGFTFARVLSGVGAGERMLSAAHAADAINRTQPAGGAAVAGSGGAFDPPPPARTGDAAAAATGTGTGAGAGAGSGGGTGAAPGAAPGESAPGGGSSGDSPHDGDRVGHEIPVNESKGASPRAAVGDGDGVTPLDAQTVVSNSQPGFGGVAASDIGGAFDPPPPTIQLPDEQPAMPPGGGSPSGPSPAGPEDGGVGTRVPDAAAAPPAAGGAFDPPPPSLDLPRTAADDAADAVGPAQEGAAAGDYEAERSWSPEADAQDAAADAGRAASDHAAANANDSAPGDSSSGARPRGDVGTSPVDDSSSTEQADARAIGEAKASTGGYEASDAAAAQAEANAARGSAPAAPGTGASSGGAFDPPPPSVELPHGAADDAAAAGKEASDAAAEKAAEKAANEPPPPKPAPTPPYQPTPQEVADKAQAAADEAEAAAAQADAETAAARQVRQDAVRAADAADIKHASADPGDDPDVAAARERVRAAQNSAEKADNAALDGDDPWDPNAPNKSAAEAFQREIKDAKQAQANAESAFAAKHAGDADPAKAAAQAAQDALNVAKGNAWDAHNDATNLGRKAVQAANEAAHAPKPEPAPADDASDGGSASDHTRVKKP